MTIASREESPIATYYQIVKCKLHNATMTITTNTKTSRERKVQGTRLSRAMSFIYELAFSQRDFSAEKASLILKIHTYA